LQIIKHFLEHGIQNEQWGFMTMNEDSWAKVKLVFEEWLTACPLTAEGMMEIWSKDTYAMINDNSEENAFTDLTNKFREHQISLVQALSDEKLSSIDVRNLHINASPE
jgi:hypothetical protein